MTGTCGPGAFCNVSGIAQLTMWAQKVFDTKDLTGTVVVVSIINTVSNTTRITTIAEEVPAGFTPPPTNSAGTRIASITYSHQGKLWTTTV
jgi:hypothetical protein